MFLKSATRKPALTAGLSVALLALMTGMAQAQDPVLSDPPAPTGEETILIAGEEIVDGEVPCDPCVPPGDGEVFWVIDPIEGMDGEPINTDGIGDGEPLPIDTEWVEDGEPINTDGIGDGEPLPVFTDGIGDGEIVPVYLNETGDGEPLPVNTDGIGDGEPLPDLPAEEFPDSNCGGCELENLAGGPEVQRTESETVQRSGGNSTFDAGAEVVSDENNICYNADLYIPLLCDWQRPFVGDRMP